MTGKPSFQEDTVQLVLRRPVERAASCFSFLFLFAKWKIKQEVRREDILYHMNTFYHPAPPTILLLVPDGESKN